jgi:hypothetical protein
MHVALLPVLTLATTETITFDSRDELERALTVRVRSAIETGWALVDVSPEDDGSGFGFTVTRDGDARRHVADFDGNVYRVGPAALPEHPTKPSDLLLQALREGGGIELSSGCGYDVQAYFIDGYAVGPQARELAARSLAAADDLEGAWISDRRATFQLETDEQAIDLIVTLTEDGGVAETELRRYESRADRTVYRRRGAMTRALHHAFISSIHEDGDSLVLRTSRGRFAIDPGGTSFRSRHGDDEYEGCGC